MEKIENKNLVSAIITTYNRPLKILKRALNSVLNQTYPNIEIILINACPENKNLSYEIKEYTEMLPNINYVCLDKNSLAGKAIENSEIMEKIIASVKDTWNPSVLDINADELLIRFNTGYDHHFRSINDKYESDKIIVERCLRNRNAELNPESVIYTMSAVVLYLEKKRLLSEMHCTTQSALL